MAQFAREEVKARHDFDDNERSRSKILDALVHRER